VNFFPLQVHPSGLLPDLYSNKKIYHPQAQKTKKTFLEDTCYYQNASVDLGREDNLLWLPVYMTPD
jgi:hypothetical protein